MITLLFGSLAALFLAVTFSTLFHVRWARRLPGLSALGGAERADGEGGGGSPLFSVVIAARDEASQIEETIRHVLGQRGVPVQVIVVNDRSTDRTGEILERLATEDPRVRVEHVTTLPAGWLGKCHACHVGAKAATGAWILFTDADCRPKPDVLARAWRVAEREGADHITLTPGASPESLAAQAWHLAFLFSLANWFSGVNRDRKNAHLGMGAFNLVRTEAYRACGGYEALRLTVMDDVKLGLLLRRAGKRTRGFIGGDDVPCQWGRTVRNMVHLLEKNYFAMLNYQLGLAVAGGFAGITCIGLAAAGPWTGTWAGLAAGVAPLTWAWPALTLARRLGWPWKAAALTPFIFPALLFALLNSTYVTTRNGGVRWRETFYPLALLREGTVR